MNSLWFLKEGRFFEKTRTFWTVRFLLEKYGYNLGKIFIFFLKLFFLGNQLFPLKFIRKCINSLWFLKEGRFFEKTRTFWTVRFLLEKYCYNLGKIFIFFLKLFFFESPISFVIDQKMHKLALVLKKRTFFFEKIRTFWTVRFLLEK